MGMICDITNMLEAIPSPIFSVHMGVTAIQSEGMKKEYTKVNVVINCVTVISLS